MSTNHVPSCFRITLATPKPISHRTAEENLGLGYLASTLRTEGFSVNIVDAWLLNLSHGDLINRLLKPTPHLLGLSSYRSNIAQTRQIIEQLSRDHPAIPVVVGGYGPTLYPSDFLEIGARFVIRGEAESSLTQLARNLMTKSEDLSQVSGLSFLDKSGHVRNNPITSYCENLDLLPFPARDTLPHILKRKSTTHIASSRGCFANCQFCSIANFMRLAPGRNWRLRSKQNIVAELSDLVNKGSRVFKFVDDSFIEPPRDSDWAQELSNAIQKAISEPILFRISIRADRTDASTIKALKSAGLFSVSCGIENFSPTALRRMSKAASIENNFHALEIFKKNSISVQAGHILFDPYTTITELKENLNGMKKFPWTISKGIFSETFPAEGTRFTEKLRRNGLLNTDDGNVEAYSYSIIDCKAQIAYGVLKHWHRSLGTLYDKIIDPVSAPKAITLEEHNDFLNHSNELKQLDLTVFEETLNLIDSGFSERAILQRIKSIHRSLSEKLLKLDSSVNRLYQSANLQYDGDPNPFLC